LTDTTGHDHQGSTSKAGRKYIAHAKDPILIPDITVGFGAFLAPRWNVTHRAKDWTLYGGDLTTDIGHPAGVVFYRHDADGRTVRVAVGWNSGTERLDFVALHPGEPREAVNIDAEERDALLLDARSRLGHLQGFSSQIGARVMTHSSNEALVEASGLGILGVEMDEEGT
jgi:hypothetical protein